MRARKVDRNHSEIRRSLRELGWYVFDTSKVGDGFPDLLVVRSGVIRFIEVKAPKGKLNEAQEAFRRVFPVAVLRNVDDAINLR